MTIPNKSQWQAIKKKHGIPSNLVGKVKMGDKFDWYEKTMTKLRAARDYPGQIKAMDELVKDMSLYAKAMKAADPKKFKGKKPADQQKSHKTANEEYKKIFGEVSKLKETINKLAKPLLGVQLALKKAQNKFKSINKKSSSDDYSSFYKEEFRGINLPLKMLAKINQDPGIKRGIIGFLSHANTINNMIALKAEEFSAPEAHGRISTALELLAGEVAGKR